MARQAHTKDAGFLALYGQFSEVLNAGDETRARTFVTDHFKEFPQDVQDELLLAFFEEALEQTGEGATLRNQLAQETIAAAQTLQKAKRILEDKLKAAELMEKAE